MPSLPSQVTVTSSWFMCPSKGHQHGVSIQSSIWFGWNTFPNSAQMDNRRDLNLGEVVYISIIFHIPASWMVAIFFFDGVSLQTSQTDSVMFVFLCFPIQSLWPWQRTRLGDVIDHVITSPWLNGKYNLFEWRQTCHSKVRKGQVAK